MPGPRILTYLHSFDPGGVERVALRLVKGWPAAGLDVDLFVGRAEGALRQELADGLDFAMPRALRFSVAPIETLWMVLTLPGHIRRTRPDILFCAGNSYTIVAVAMKLLLGRHCPPVVAKISNTLRRRDLPWVARPFYRLWLRIQGRFLDQLVGMAKPMAAEIAEAMAVPPNKIAIIPDPALTEAQISELAGAAPPPRLKHRRFVSLARLVPQKDLKLMLRAFARGGAPEDRLTIYGDGPERAALVRLAHKLGIAGRVTLAGHRPECAALLSEHDIFLLSSAYEGVPAALLEALAAGLPVIATDCSLSMAALLNHGRLGQLVPVGDTAALAIAIRDARSDCQDRAAARAQASRFTLEHAAGAYAMLFRQLSPRPEPAPMKTFFLPAPEAR